MKRFLIVFFVLGLILLNSFVIPSKVAAYYTNMPATVVLGQTDFVSGGSATTASSLNVPITAASDGTRLYVVDGSNNRVLIWNTIPTTNGAPADLVLGQPNFVSSTANNGGISAATLSAPRDLWIDSGRLFVSDLSNNRVLIWNSLPTTNQQPADVVVGKPDFVTSASQAATFSNLGLPWGINTYQGKLLISDNINLRILIFNSVPTTNGAAADVVVGQTDMTTGSFGTLDASHFGSSSNGSGPRNIWIYNGKLLVADNVNSRVLIWNSIPTTNGAAADVVVGQPNFTSSTPNNSGVSCSSLDGSDGLTVTPNGRLVIGDNNSRVLIWNSIPVTNSATADIVLGQPNCTTSDINSGGISNRSLNNRPRGVAQIGNKLYVADSSNNRVLIFNNTTGTGGSVSSPTLSMNSPVSIGSGRLRIVGTVIIGDRGTSVIQYVQASVNGLGYGNVTSLSSGRDLGTTQTIYDWYHDFDPTQGDSALSPSTSNYTIKFQTSDFNADLNYLFYFQPFTLKSVKTLGLNQTIYFNVNKNQLQKIKDNVSHFEVWSKLTSTSSWTKYIDSILPNQIDSNGDVYVTKSISSLTSLPTRYKVLAIDNWNNSQESNILSFVSSPLPVGILQPTPFLTQFPTSTPAASGEPSSPLQNISETIQSGVSNLNLPSLSLVLSFLTRVGNVVKPVFPVVLLGLLPVLGVVTLLTNIGLSGTSFSWNLITKILQAFGLLPKENASGIVYDTKTGSIVPFAVLTLTSQTGILITLITDSKGVYHGVNLTPGVYKMIVKHHEYEFPTKNQRPPLVNIKDFYKGESFSVSSQEEKQFLIVPMDGRGRGKNSTKTILTVLNSISKLLFIPMLVFSTLVVAANPTPFNIMIAAIYTLIFWYKVLHLFSFPTLKGRITDESGTPIPDVIITLTDSNQTVVEVTRTNSSGHYKLYSPRDTYQMYISKDRYVSSNEVQTINTKKEKRFDTNLKLIG